MEYVDVRVAMVTLLLSVAALVVVFVLMLRKQKRMYVAGLEELGKLYDNALSELSRLTNEVFKSDTKAAKLSTDLNLAKQEIAMLTEQRDVALASMKKLEDINNSLTAKGYAMHCGIENRDQEIADLISYRHQLLEANKELQDRCNMYVNMVAERDKEIGQQKEQIAAKDGDINELNQRMIGFTAENSIHKTSIENYKAEITGLKRQLAVQKGVITKLRKKLNAKEVPGE